MTILRSTRLADASERRRAGIPDATIARLPLYLRALPALGEQGVATCSSGLLAGTAGVAPTNVRKDLSYLAIFGTRGVGYDVE